MGMSFGGQGTVEGAARKQAKTYSNKPSFWSDHWTPENPNARNPRVTPQPTDNNQRGSSWWINKGSYLRLKTGELGYTLPAAILKGIKIQAARFYLSGQNILTWSKIKNFDPEISSTSGQYYPQQRVVSVGLNVTF